MRKVQPRQYREGRGGEGSGSGSGDPISDTPRSVTLTSETRRFLNSSFYLSTLMRHHMALHWFTGRCMDTVSFYQESKNYALIKEFGYGTNRLRPGSGTGMWIGKHTDHVLSVSIPTTTTRTSTLLTSPPAFWCTSSRIRQFALKLD